MQFVETIKTNIQTLSSLLRDITHLSPIHCFLTFILMLFRSISAGVSLLLIIPLLQVIGFTAGQIQTPGLVTAMIHLYHGLHIPLTLISILCSYIVIISIIASAGYAEQILSTTLQQTYIHHLRTSLYQQILHSQWSFFIKQKPSQLLHALTTQIQTISATQFQIFNLLHNLLFMSAYIALAFVLSWQMTLVALGCALLLLSLILPLHQITAQSGQSHLAHNHRLFQSISEQLSALKMVKSTGKEEVFIQNIIEQTQTLEQHNKRLTYITAGTKFIHSIGAVCIFSVLLFLALKVFALPFTSLCLELVVFARLLPMVSNIQQSYQRILYQLPAFSDVKKLLNTCVNHQENLRHTPQDTPIFQHSIKLNKLSFSYHKTKTPLIFSNLSCEIQKNTTTAIIGPSGSGKSTLVDLIVGLLTPTHGSIYIDDQTLSPHHALAWRGSIAYITQDVFLFHASLRDNLKMFMPDATDKDLMHVLKASAAEDFVHHLEYGLDTVIGDRGIRLSGGERQRIAIARALLTKPSLLILDEGTNALDEDNVLKIQHTLNQLHGSLTILIISHQKQMAHLVDQTIRLNIADQRNEIWHPQTLKETLN